MPVSTFTKTTLYSNGTVNLCKNNPHTLFVFGDNLRREGCGGQAVIRYCVNSYGIPTKRLPSMKEDAFFKDAVSDLQAVEHSIETLWTIARCGIFEYISFPQAGLGTGLARLPVRSPLIFKYLNTKLYQYFKIYEMFVTKD